jgi:uncharacterized protein YerC
MQLSQRRMNPQLKRQLSDLLHKVLADIKDPQELELFFDSFLSKSELDLITRRLGIIYLLSRKQSYAYIKKNLAVSSATVANIARNLKSNNKSGLKVALEKIDTDEWADRWMKKIGSVMKFGRD